MNSIGILGAGTWGIALARMLCNERKDVTVWSALEDEIEVLSVEKKHPKLKYMILPDEIKYTTSVEEVCKDKDIILFAVPSVFVRATAKLVAPYINENQIVVDVAKGIEADTLMTLTEVIADELQGATKKVVALSGPTHAEEVVQDLPTTIVSSSIDIETAKQVQDFFSSQFMRVYTNSDIVGTEICGAFKNIIALATGIAEGLGYGDNAKAAIMTRGLAEISRLGRKLGCDFQTFGGLAGMGDLIVTCTSIHSRNRRCGYLIGKGMKVQNAIQEVGMVVEGINAIPAAIKLAAKHQVEIPIIQAVNEIINEKNEAQNIAKELLHRKKKDEGV